MKEEKFWDHVFFHFSHFEIAQTHDVFRPLDHDSRQVPDNLRIKLFKTSSGWSTSPDSQDTKMGEPVQAALPGAQSQYEQRPQFTPPPPGTPHYETLRRLEAESRRQVEASRQLNAYLAFMMTNQAMFSSAVGGIQGYPAQLPQAQFYQPNFVV